MNLHNAVRVLVVAIFVVVEHSLACRFTDLREEPFDTGDVQKSLHTEEIDGDLNHVTLAHLSDWLDQRALPDALLLVCHGLVRIITLV